MEPGPSAPPCVFVDCGSLPSTKNRAQFTQSEKLMILNVYKHVKDSWTDDEYGSKHKIKILTGNILGISGSAVYRVIKEFVETDRVQPPTLQKRRTLLRMIDYCDKSYVRRIVHSFYFDKKLPTVNSVLEVIKSDQLLPNMSRTSLRKLLKDVMSFRLLTCDKLHRVVENDKIALSRIEYLKKIRTYRAQNRPIYYLDEAWVNPAHIVSLVWEDTTMHSHERSLLADLMPRGERISVLHVNGGEHDKKEIKPESDVVFECKSTDDYHIDYQESICKDQFENWFQGVLPKLMMNAVIVMDNISYHSRRLDKAPVPGWTKQHIQKWLSAKQIFFEPTENKAQLLKRAACVKSQYQSYAVDDMAKRVGIEVLRLPMYHCDLNPLELVWTDVKRYVATKGTKFKMEDIPKLLQEALNNVSAEKWKNFINQVKEEECRLEPLDHIIDETTDSYEINVKESSDGKNSDTAQSDYSDSDDYYE